MTPTPSLTLKDDYIDELGCAICGQPALQVIHVETFPDYVTCSICGSAFVVEEGGERVMYGKIDNAYPETQHVALRQWIWPETVEKQPDRRPLQRADTRQQPRGTAGPGRDATSLAASVVTTPA